MREGQKTLAEQQQKEAQQQNLEDAKRSSSRDSFSKDDRDSPILNLSNKSTHENNSDISAGKSQWPSDFLSLSMFDFCCPGPTMSSIRCCSQWTGFDGSR